MTGKGLAVALTAMFLFGTMIGGAVTASEEPEPEVITETVTEVKEKQVTPQSCKDVIETDNEIFRRIGEAFQTFDLDKIDSTTQYINDVTPRRTSNIEDCFRR